MSPFLLSFDSVSYVFSSITVLIGSIGFLVWWKVFRIPPALRHLPTLPMVYNFYCQIKEMGFEERFDKLCRPYQHNPLSLEWLPPVGWTVIISDLANFRFMTQHTDIFQKVILSDIVPHGLPNMFFGKNILFSNDNDWRFFRRTCTPAFKHGWDLGVFEVTSQRLVDQWSKLESKDIPLGPWFARFALDGFGLSIFTTDFGSILDEKSHFSMLYRKIIHDILDFRYLLFNKLDSRWNPHRRPVYERVDEFDEYIYGLIQGRREAKDRGEPLPKDLLTSFLDEHKSVDEDGEKITRVMTDKELRDNLCTFILAGHDTTMVSLSTSMYCLGMDLGMQERAREAVKKATKASGDTEALMHVPYLDAVIRESLRLYPPAAHLMERRVTQDVVMPTGEFIPKGAFVTGHTWALHRDPAVWGEDAEEYRPERHLITDEEGNQTLNSCGAQLMAFSYGPRTCMGMNFAMAEMRVVLSRLLQAFIWTSIPNENRGPSFETAYLLAPRNMSIRVTRRKECLG